MPWKTINQLEGCFDLTPEEQAILQGIRASNVAELSQILIARLKNEEHQDC